MVVRGRSTRDRSRSRRPPQLPASAGVGGSPPGRTPR